MTDTPDTMLDMLREREKQLEREYIEANNDADKMVAIANARLTEVRELIERLAIKKRGRPRKDAITTTTALMGPSVHMTETDEVLT